MKSQFDVQMNRSYMFDFLMHHTYGTVKGKCSLLLGVAAAILAILTWGKVNMISSGIYIAAGIFCLFAIPGNLWVKSGKITTGTKSYRLPFTYKIDATGITTIQKDQTAHANWKQIVKVTESHRCLYVYISNVTAFVWPKKSIGQEYQTVLGILKEHIEKDQLKIRFPK